MATFFAERLEETPKGLTLPHSIGGRAPAHCDVMRLRNLTVNPLFYAGATGSFPQDIAQVKSYQFDRITAGCRSGDHSVFRLCCRLAPGIPARILEVGKALGHP